MGLTVAFARDLAKHAPLSLHYLMRVIASGDANAWAGSSHPPFTIERVDADSGPQTPGLSKT